MYFQRTVFIPPGIVSALKRTSFYTKWYFKCFSENSFSTPPHSLASPDEVSTPGIVSRKSKLSFLSKVCISEIISSFKVISIILE